MAFNLSALKALFSKLKPAAKAIAPVTDDAARLVANYGDDVARGVANYGDDVANAVANYGDDALAVANKLDDLTPNMSLAKSNYSQLSDEGKMLLDLGLSPGFSKNGRDVMTFANGDLGIDGKLFHYPDNLATRSDFTKARIMDDISGLTGLTDSLKNNFPNYEPNSDSLRALNSVALTRGSDPMLTGNDSAWLGFSDLTDDGVNFRKVIYDKERFPLKGLVDDWTESSTRKGTFLGERRPHRNTALGRWYGQAIDDPKHLTRYNVPIGPERNYVQITPDLWEFIGPDDELPF